jgi:transcriptional antiterminator RfaH
MNKILHIISIMKKWYLVKTKPRQEVTALKNLAYQKYSTYCPTGTINDKVVVLFPGYIFIHLDKDNENWSPVSSTKGVLNFVRFGLNFAQVPDNIIELIKSNQRSSTEKLKNLNKFKVGDKVQITDGVFKSWIAILNSFKSDERVTLLIKLMGQQQQINVKQKSLIGL